MELQEIRSHLLDLYKGWRTAGSQNPFRMHVARRDPEIYRHLAVHPLVFRELPKRLQRAWCGRKVQPIGPITLERHWNALTTLYVHRCQTGQYHASILQFVNQILAACEAEEDLIEFLHETNSG